MIAGNAVPDGAVVAGSSPRASERSRAIRRFDSNEALGLFLSDLLMIAVASCLAIWCIIQFNHTLYARVAESALIWTAASMWVFKELGLYRISYALDCKDEWYYVIVGLTIGITPLLLFFSAIPSLSSSRLVLIASFALSIVLVGTSRSLIHGRFKARGDQYRRRIALVAASEHLLSIADAMGTSSSSLSFVAVRDTEEAISAALNEAAVSWYDRVKEEGCNEIIFAGMPTAYTAFMVERAARDHITIGFAPPGFSSQAGPLGVLTAPRQSILIAGRIAARKPTNLFLKRLFDIVVASAALVLTFPIMLAAIVAIGLESGRPVIFRQTRIGRGGKPFEILKLRSMVRDAEAKCGPVWAIGDPVKDHRTTKVGAFIRKTSIDELPQFINVLRGEMSIVGPRPERPCFVEHFRKENLRYDERHLVRPGITGWAHVHMRRSPGLELIGERLDLDLFYIENYSLLLDIFITFKTGVEVLFQRWY
jgi:exopolysaccharide biosynthesis polyprenyl glycosylphosphotransferase